MITYRFKWHDSGGFQNPYNQNPYNHNPYGVGILIWSIGILIGSIGNLIGSVGILIGSVGISIGSVWILRCRDYNCRDFDTNPNIHVMLILSDSIDVMFAEIHVAMYVQHTYTEYQK